jgi:opacity protein-like surface antigen
MVSVLLAVVLSSRLAGQEDGRTYVRVGGGWDSSERAALFDRACDLDPMKLLTLFGCGPEWGPFSPIGDDGRRIGARGTFGRAATMEAALGLRLRPAVRVELEVSRRMGLDFSGNANFIAAGAVQPVNASGEQTGVLARMVLDIVVDPIGPFVPYVDAAFGASRTTVGDVAFLFPGLASQPASTTVVGGAHWSRAWQLGGGASVGIADRTSLELGYRFSDLGRVQTEDGAITVVRGARTNVIGGVAGLSGRLRTQGGHVSIRRAF